MLQKTLKEHLARGTLWGRLNEDIDKLVLPKPSSICSYVREDLAWLGNYSTYRTSKQVIHPNKKAL